MATRHTTPVAAPLAVPVGRQGAAAALEAVEFTDVRVLEGGLQAWEALAEEGELPPLVVDDDGDGGLTGAWV